MAQWSHAEKTLYAKLVYYGPAFGGKTTNLESLHRITDPDGSQQLLSLKTSDDRTLFFDLLPFDLGNILGHQVAMKLYTVPGQVHYDATRRVVLAGADAVIFVADSSPDRQQLNRESLENLRLNMRANRLDPATVPVIFQFNKQDLAGAAPPDEVAAGLEVNPGDGFAAVALSGAGVMETFMAASKAMVRRLAAFAGNSARREFDVGKLDEHLDRAFAPFLARVEAAEALPTIPAPGESRRNDAIVADGDDLVERSVQSSLKLGEELSAERVRAARLGRETLALRHLCETLRCTGASFEGSNIVDRTLQVASEVVGAAVLTLASSRPGETDCVYGRDRDPLRSSADGSALLERLLASTGPCVVDDLDREFPEASRCPGLAGIRAVAALPVESTGWSELIAYAPKPDGRFDEDDVRFLATVASHLAVALEKAALYQELARHRDRLEEAVRERTRDLTRANEELRAMERVKDRFLSNVSHEIRTPLTAVVNAASFLSGYEADPETQKDMADAILESCSTMESHLENIFRMVRADAGAEPLRVSEATPAHLAAEALQLAGTPEVSINADPRVESLVVDLPRLARAVANLLDNAAKFSDGNQVELRIRAGQAGAVGPDAAEEVVIGVLDRGPGIPPEDRERIFAPFEQGGDLLTGKPSGIGLGLHEARAIARQHGGSLEHVPRDGGGSEFRITVPAVVHGEQSVAEVESA